MAAIRAGHEFVVSAWLEQPSATPDEPSAGVCDGRQAFALDTTESAQLTAHLSIGMNNGLSAAEVSEAITYLAFYVGWPNAFSALPVAKNVFEKRPK
jgi:alkylhydroperoxidase/carboxymuconolactone decarboxylase family protein YurZ